MVKVARPGRVKTRLGRDLGMTTAAWWFRHQVQGLLRCIRDPRWQVVLAVAPDREGMAARIWPADLPRIPQGKGNLGDRMKRVMRAAPAGPVCVIGGDIPGVTRQELAHAFEQLKGHDAVFGPADDGGYWLVGLRNARAVPESLFQNTRWSTEHALADSIASLPGSKVALANVLHDVDTIKDLARGKPDRA
jgi:rSAM/selenodomain-associated transferase 1